MFADSDSSDSSNSNEGSVLPLAPDSSLTLNEPVLEPQLELSDTMQIIEQIFGDGGPGRLIIIRTVPFFEGKI